MEEIKRPFVEIYWDHELTIWVVRRVNMEFFYPSPFSFEYPIPDAGQKTTIVEEYFLDKQDAISKFIKRVS